MDILHHVQSLGLSTNLNCYCFSIIISILSLVTTHALHCVGFYALTMTHIREQVIFRIQHIHRLEDTEYILSSTLLVLIL